MEDLVHSGSVTPSLMWKHNFKSCVIWIILVVLCIISGILGLSFMIAALSMNTLGEYNTVVKKYNNDAEGWTTKQPYHNITFDENNYNLQKQSFTRDGITYPMYARDIPLFQNHSFFDTDLSIRFTLNPLHVVAEKYTPFQFYDDDDDDDDDDSSSSSSSESHDPITFKVKPYLAVQEKGMDSRLCTEEGGVYANHKCTFNFRAAAVCVKLDNDFELSDKYGDYGCGMSSFVAQPQILYKKDKFWNAVIYSVVRPETAEEPSTNVPFQVMFERNPFMWNIDKNQGVYGPVPERSRAPYTAVMAVMFTFTGLLVIPIVALYYLIYTSTRNIVVYSQFTPL